MDTKLIVSHRGALRAKYGPAGLAAVNKAVAALAEADSKRGLKTRLLFLDDSKQMKAVGGTPVALPGSPAAHKAAIDAAYLKLQPAYLMILGSIDVVPHQDMDNPVQSPEDDDPKAWGDLPYACDEPYARDPARFVGPTRVVGRLPDMTGAKDPAHLLKLLEVAARHTGRPPAAFADAFGLSAAVWKGSTRLSLDELFGPTAPLLTSPASGPAHPAAALAARAHFINCHGAPASPAFQGEKNGQFFEALTTATLAGKVSVGTVAAAECCFGAELYDAPTLALDMPICQSYLAQAGAGFFGSTTIAYGPEDTNGAADLVCQYFLKSVFEGASLGRAALVARQQFVQQAAQMDPVDLKTLAQFVLLGDPSLQPVVLPTEIVMPKSAGQTQSDSFARAERRASMKATGRFLSQTKATASRRAKGFKLSPTVKKALSGIAQAAGMPGNTLFTAYALKGGTATSAAAKKAQSQPLRYHVALRTEAASKPAAGARRGVAVVAKELDGRIVGYRVYRRR